MNNYYSGLVIHGLQNGRKFGFRTANLHLNNPPDIGKGVYAVWVWVDDIRYMGMLYVGTRPTLNLNELSYEIHILAFRRNIYDKVISFSIVKKMRDEKRFNGTDELIQALNSDRESIRTLLKYPTRRLATKADLPAIMVIIEQARRRLKALGINQWQDGYPNEEVILDDIARKQGHVFVKDGQIIAYAAIVFDKDPYYEVIDGQWLSNRPYVVVHRIAVHDHYTQQGIAYYILHTAEMLANKRGVTAFRIDTHMGNHYMRNLIRRYKFTLCGIVQVRDGKRLAYEK